MMVSYYYFFIKKGFDLTHWLVPEKFHILVNMYKLPYAVIIGTSSIFCRAKLPQ